MSEDKSVPVYSRFEWKEPEKMFHGIQGEEFYLDEYNRYNKEFYKLVKQEDLDFLFNWIFEDTYDEHDWDEAKRIKEEYNDELQQPILRVYEATEI